MEPTSSEASPIASTKGHPSTLPRVSLTKSGKAPKVSVGLSQKRSATTQKDSDINPPDSTSEISQPPLKLRKLELELSKQHALVVIQFESGPGRIVAWTTRHRTDVCSIVQGILDDVRSDVVPDIKGVSGEIDLSPLTSGAPRTTIDTHDGDEMADDDDDALDSSEEEEENDDSEKIIDLGDDDDADEVPVKKGDGYRRKSTPYQQTGPPPPPEPYPYVQPNYPVSNYATPRYFTPRYTAPYSSVRPFPSPYRGRPHRMYPSYR